MQFRLVNRALPVPLLVMAAIETVILFSALYVAGIAVFGDYDQYAEIVGPVAPKAAIIAGLILISLVAMGLYRFNQRYYFREAALRVLVGLSIGALLIALMFLVMPVADGGQEYAFHLVVGVSFAYSLVLLLAVRYLFFRTVDTNVFRRRTLVYGAGRRAASIAGLRRKADRRGFKIVGQITAPGETIVGEDRGVMAHDGRSITEVARERKANEIVVALDERRGNLPVRDLLEARLQGIDVIDLIDFLERETGKIRVDLVSPGWLLFAPGFVTSTWRRVYTRAFDLLSSLVLLALAWPLMVIVAVVIKIEDGWAAPVFYRQSRVGKNGKVFKVIKFRSMSVDAESDGKAVWAQENDARITKTGGVLRNNRIDELPQVFNVILGQMSLVGPRPERPEFVEELQSRIPYYSKRHTVKPGITGWAQLQYGYGASEEDAIEKLQYDLYYIKNQNLVLDLMIVLQTVEVVLWGNGAR
jgi:sugar transferase (PEP-CTERM system associated)